MWSAPGIHLGLIDLLNFHMSCLLTITIYFFRACCKLNKIWLWFKANKLLLNLAKTKYSLFHPASIFFLREPLPFLKIDNITIESENVTKFLGVLIDGNLSWKNHINDVSTKSIGILYKSRGIVKQSLLTVVFFFYSLSFELCKCYVGKHLEK